jgi:hypothetical protein
MQRVWRQGAADVEGEGGGERKAERRGGRFSQLKKQQTIAAHG